MHEVDKEDDPFAMYEYDAINVRTVLSLPMSSTLIMQTLMKFPVIGNYSVSLQMSLLVIR